MLKKIITAATVSALTAAAFTGCSAAERHDDGRLDVICTIFPVYDWTREVIGGIEGDVQLTYLMGSGADLHNYQPTADDMIRISDCDVFIYVGGESDQWVDGVLGNVRNKDMIVIDLMDVLGESSLYEEELKDGMEAPDEEDEDEDESEPEYDEHIWLSLRNAQTCTNAIAEKLSEADADNADTYRANAASYTEKLAQLDSEIGEMTSSVGNKTLIFADRFPFRYFVDDYGLDYYAAFLGCSAESEASFSTIAFLADKADELGADCVFTIDGSDCSIADAVVSNTKTKSQKIVTLDSLQSVSGSDTEKGAYLNAMNKNYELLKEALN